MIVCCCLLTKLCLTFCDPMGCSLPARFLCPWEFPGKNPGASCHFLLQGIFLIQGLNQRLLHWRVDSLANKTQFLSLRNGNTK